MPLKKMSKRQKSFLKTINPHFIEGSLPDGDDLRFADSESESFPVKFTPNENKMKPTINTQDQTATDITRTFDLFRLTKAKEIVDLAPNTLRAYNALGLPFYRRGKAVFISKAELEEFIRTGKVAPK